MHTQISDKLAYVVHENYTAIGGGWTEAEIQACTDSVDFYNVKKESVTVYHPEVIRGKQLASRINWASFGNSGVKDAQEFAAQLALAITLAAKYDAEAGL